MNIIERNGTGSGVNLEECTSFDDMMRTSGTNWKAEKVPLYTANGLQVEDAFAIQRSTDGKILCPNVSSRYKIFDQEEFAPLADGLISMGAKPVSGGGFYGGKRIWYQFELENRKILGDEHKHYVYLTNSYDTTGAVAIATSLVRIVCSNALNMMLKNAVSKWSYAHIGDVSGKIDEATKTILLSNNYADEYAKEAEILSGMLVDDEYVKNILHTVVPMPVRKDDTDEALYQMQVAKVQATHNGILDIFKTKEDLQDMRDSKLKVLQSVADYASHPQFTKLRAETMDNYNYKLMLGNTLLNRTYQALVA